jgi:hypothetical protein
VWRKSGALTADLNGTELILDADADTSITADTDDTIDFKTGGTDQFQITNTTIDLKPGGTSQATFVDGAILPTADNDIDLGSPTYEFKDIYVDGTANLDAISTDGITISTSGNITINSIVQGKDVTVAIHRKIVQIGDWNMDADASVGVTHGLDYTKIRSVTGLIYSDSGTTNYIIPYAEQIYISYNSTVIYVGRQASSGFDTVNFDATSFNRGYLIIDYVD